jgi:hypothetical protein
VIYNARVDKGQKPDLESQFILYGNGAELFKSQPEAVDLGSVGDFERIPIKMKLRLLDSIPAGEYILLLQVRDKRAKKGQDRAAQIFDFRVVSK